MKTDSLSHISIKYGYNKKNHLSKLINIILALIFIKLIASSLSHLQTI